MAEASKVREEKPVASTQSSEESGATATASSTPTVEKKDSNTPAASVVDTKTTPEIGKALLERLARQVEYYFSSANLSKDTYVATLRTLNDGYVPVSIIANFGKVKSLVPYDAMNAVRMAATEFSELLEVVEIDTQTGKRVKGGDDSNNSSDVPIIAAVGPVSGEPIPISVIPAAPVTPPAVKSITAPIQNTVIIREVPEGTEESHIRQLFTFESCPAIESLHLDVANCWFVTLDTSSRDDMVNVMFELRKMKYQSGEPVLARLKSGVVLSAVSQPFIPSMYPPSAMSSNGYSNGNRKNKKNKKNNSSHNGNGGKSRTNGNGNNQNKNGGGRGKNGGSTRSRNNSNKQQKKASGQERQNSPTSRKGAEPQTPPSFGEEHFPTLPTDDMNGNNKIEVEKVPDQVERRPEDDSSCDGLGKPKANSDSGSTATTTSSENSSTKPNLGGYAAALKKAAPPAPSKPEPTKKTQDKKQSKNETEGKKSSKSAKTKESVVVETPVVDAGVGVEPPSWGGGRTFASLLQKQ